MTEHTTMEKKSNAELLDHIRHHATMAMENENGTDPNTSARIHHARKQIQLAVDELHARNHQFDYRTRMQMPYIQWQPTSIDLRLMVRTILQGQKPIQAENGTYKLLLTPQGTPNETTRQYRSIGEIIIKQAIRQGADHSSAARQWLQQIPNATQKNSIEIPLPTTDTMWHALAEHLKNHPQTQVAVCSTDPKCTTGTVQIADLITQLHHPHTTTPTTNTQLNNPRPKARWFQRLFFAK